MSRSCRKTRHFQLQLDLHFELLVEVERRADPKEAFEVYAKTFLTDYSFRQKDPFWASIAEEELP
mgnify:FL=1|jgi:ABC-type uncharacterized transport system substrate-binding protein